MGTKIGFSLIYDMKTRDMVKSTLCVLFSHLQIIGVTGDFYE